MKTIDDTLRTRTLLRVAAALWVVWGLVHTIARFLVMSRDTTEAVQGKADKVEPSTLELLAALVGGLADLGYFLFLDLGGYVEFVPGTVMTIVSATAIIVSFTAYFTRATVTPRDVNHRSISIKETS